MRTVFISSGHSNKPGRDRGASGNGYIEGVEAVRVRKAVVAELKFLGLNAVVDVDDSILSETMATFKNKTSKDSIVVDIHFNAATPQAKGVETLIPANPTLFEKELGSALSKGVADVLGTSIRGKVDSYAGVKTELESARKTLGWMRLTGENVLIETCFITNPNEMASYEVNFSKLCKTIARILYDYATKDDLKLVSSSTYHTVRAGENLSRIANIYRTTVAKIVADNGLETNVLQIGQKLKIIK
jgi:N-acetylmuramoyl-L-alanine amidase